MHKSHIKQEWESVCLVGRMHYHSSALYRHSETTVLRTDFGLNSVGNNRFQLY